MLGYKVDAIDIRGGEKGKPVFFPMSHPNIFLTAKKKSGKSNLIYHLMRNIVGKNTKIYVFCSTANRDQTWKQMIKELEDKGNDVTVYTSLYRTDQKGKRKQNVNQLEELINSWTDEEKPRKKKKGAGKKKDKQKERPTSVFDRKITFADLPENHIAHSLFRKAEVNPDPPKKDKETKVGGASRKIYSDKIVIFDDLSEQIKDPLIPALLKKNRHYKATCIISSQFPNDIAPSARSQFDIVMAWAGHSPNKVEVIRRMCDTDLDEGEFYRIYKEATNESYSFLYANCRDNELWKRFDERLR